VPFSFALDPTLMLGVGSWWDSLVGFLRMSVGLGLMAAALGRWFLGRIGRVETVPLGLGGALLAWPTFGVNLAGCLLAGLVVVPRLWQRLSRRSSVDAERDEAALLADGGTAGADTTIPVRDATVRRYASVLRSTDVPGLQVSLGAGDVVSFTTPLTPQTIMASWAALEMGMRVGFAPEDRVEAHAQAALTVVPEALASRTSTDRHTFVAAADLEVLAAGREPDPAPAARERTYWCASTGGLPGWRVRSEEWDAHHRRALESLGMQTNERLLLHSGAVASSPVLMLCAWAPFVLPCTVATSGKAEQEPQEWLSLVERLGITTAIVTPEQLEAIVAFIDEERATIATSLTALICPRRGLNDALIRASIDTFGPIVTQIYEPTGESWAFVLDSDEWLESPETIGARTTARSFRTKQAPVEGTEEHESHPILVQTLAAMALAGAQGSERDYRDVGLRGRVDRAGYVFLDRSVEAGIER
jgi:fluoride ion exporter CrcB/FEX